jgi:hypothetical protein
MCGPLMAADGTQRILSRVRERLITEGCCGSNGSRTSLLNLGGGLVDDVDYGDRVGLR